MKKLLGLIIVNLMWFNNSYSEQLPTKLFNIKLYDKIYDYASAEHKADKIFFSEGYESYVDTKKKPIRKLIKNSNFNLYIIDTNLENDIHRITGHYSNEIFSQYFEDECQLRQEKIKSSLVNLYKLNRNSLKKIFYKHDGQRSILYRTYQYEFRKNFNKIILNLECSYYLTKSYTGDDKVVNWGLSLDLMDRKYYEKTQKKELKKIKPFDKDLILSDLSGF